MTYSILARDPATGEMGLACQSQAFAVGSSVPWSEPGFGVIATQSMAEPMYGELGLDLLRGGLTASEALVALRTIDPHPERRQVAMIDTRGNLAAYTGSANIPAAGDANAEGCCALANMVTGPEVWTAMVERFQESSGPLAGRLVGALAAAEEAGGDIRGRRSATVTVVRAERTGRPWRDRVVDLRVDEADDPVAHLARLLALNERYHAMVKAFELALDGRPERAAAEADAVPPEDPSAEADLVLWRSIVLGMAGRESEARDLVAKLNTRAPAFVEVLRRFGEVGLLEDPALVDRLLGTRTTE